MTDRLPDETTLLQVAPDVVLRFDRERKISLGRAGAGSIPGGARSLTIIDAFSRPRPVGEVVAALGAATPGAQAWIDLTAEIMTLYRLGILTIAGEAAAPGASAFAAPSGDDLELHADMLNDAARTGAFLAAIDAAVRPGDVVVDLGTGTGVLALAAARAGARRVYAIEEGPIAQVAEAMIRNNAAGDRVTLVRGSSAEVSLPERADVIVCELVGHGPLAERMLEALLDARKRLLKPGGRVVPRRLELFGLPVSVPPDRIGWPTPSRWEIDDWETRYRLDFGALEELARQTPPTFYVRPRTARAWPTAGDPVLLADIDFQTLVESSLDRTVSWEATRATGLNGVVLFFELEFDAGARLSTRPSEADEGTHWLSQVWMLPEVWSVQPGDRLSMTYRYRTGRAAEGLQVSRRPTPA